MLGSAGSAAAGSAGVGVESWDDAADAGADADADADADAGAVASGDEASDAAGDVATSARVTLTESCICAICKHTQQVDDKSKQEGKPGSGWQPTSADSLITSCSFEGAFCPKAASASSAPPAATARSRLTSAGFR